MLVAVLPSGGSLFSDTDLLMVQKVFLSVPSMDSEDVTAAVRGLADLQLAHQRPLLDALAAAAARHFRAHRGAELSLQLSAFARLDYSPAALLAAVSDHERLLGQLDYAPQRAVPLLWALLKLDGGMLHRGRLIEVQRRVLLALAPGHNLSDRDLLCIYEVRPVDPLRNTLYESQCTSLCTSSHWSLMHALQRPGSVRALPQQDRRERLVVCLKSRWRAAGERFVLRAQGCAVAATQLPPCAARARVRCSPRLARARHKGRRRQAARQGH